MLFSLAGVYVCEPNKFPDNPWSLLPKFEDESCAEIWKLPNELSGHGGGGGWNELKLMVVVEEKVGEV